MSDYSRVVWSEGMFLRPQHFQQQERSFNFQIKQSVQMYSKYYWGIDDLELDLSLLGNGKVGVLNVSACFEDGTSIHSPVRDGLPAPLTLPANTQDQIVYLALPMDKARNINISHAEDDITRYHFQDHDVIDTTMGAGAMEMLQLAGVRLELKLGSESLTGYYSIPLVKVTQINDQGQVLLDESFIPPWLNVKTNASLQSALTQILGAIRHRADALAARIGAGQGSASSIADFLMLQLLNRYDALLVHLIEVDGVHPQALFKELLSLAGEMATFADKSKRVSTLPVYKHESLTRAFTEVMSLLNQYVGTVLEQTAVLLPIEKTNFGIFVVQIIDKQMLDQGEFVLAVNASIPAEELRSRFPAQIKIGPVEHIRELVNNQLSGISLEDLPVAPRQIPYLAGYSYFKLSPSSEYWHRLKTSGGLAMHVSGQYPDLDLQVWSIAQQ
ncbi:type VI secretion system baseplate subunit TssK [Vibrio sp. SCSIO 43136]|uniref:type VI secretion system baseplate subunit TssK n=1 Tax=Vibrio sp. SCSIO 43136 TaxID=2819101 RepID=UPI0020752EEC|nr:type VI secretion system baseplate subunit TssK [Vibrio sp. SCSIO 43136]USD67505.1 type VI secretion system baseplate subunit TssK [Vibrio sp. SCSIO 43136]